MATNANDIGLVLGQKITAVIRGEPYTITVRGWNVGNFILTDVPKIQGEVVKVAPQTGCSVRFVREGTVVMFETYVEYIYAQAISFMVVEYPRNFEKIKLRKNDRYRSNFPAEFSQTMGGISTSGSGIIRDISMEGALFCHQKPLTKASQISLKFELPQGALENLVAEVRNIRKNPKNEREPFITGLRFNDLSEEYKAILGKFIETRVEDRREQGRTQTAV